MKIGQFARKYRVSIDTVRYYMELMLIIPEKNGGQYEFGGSCERDIEEILWLKAADFSLSEIQRIFTLKRLTNLKNEEDINYYKRVFSNKKAELIKRRAEINEIIGRIDEKIMDTKDSPNEGVLELGVTLEVMNLLACPKCNEDLRLGKANIEDNYIINGKLRCSCGFEAAIEGGIIMLENNYAPSNEEKDTGGEHFIEQTSSDFVNLLYKSGQWIANKLNIAGQKDKTILELGSGSGIFLSSIFRDFQGGPTYICVDHNLELLKATKTKIEQNYKSGRFILICCDFLDIPIKNGSVDTVVDHLGTTNYNFANEGYLINLIDNKVKLGGRWLGDYLSFKPEAKSLLQYPERNRKYFYLKNIIKGIEESKFKALDMVDMGYTEKGGINESFFIEGDKLYNFVYYGEKIR